MPSSLPSDDEPSHKTPPPPTKQKTRKSNGGSGENKKKSLRSPKVLSDEQVEDACSVMSSNLIPGRIRICLHTGNTKPKMSQIFLQNSSNMKKEFVILHVFSKDYPVIETEISDLIQAHSEYELKRKEKFGNVCLFARPVQQTEPNSEAPESLKDPAKKDPFYITSEMAWGRALATRTYRKPDDSEEESEEE